MSMTIDWTSIYKDAGFTYLPIAGGDGTVADPPPAPAPTDDPPADPPAADPPAATPPVEPPAAPPVDPNIAAITEKLAEQTKLLNTLIEKTTEESAPDVWTIDKLEEAELKCHSGQYDMKYLPKITTMKALLMAQRVAKETTDGFAKENTWSDLQAKWNGGHVKAIEIFGESARDTESKLFKTAQGILHQDPGYQRFLELKSKGVKLSSIDPTLIDPNLQFKCFEIAAGRLGITRKDAAPNPTPQPRAGSRAAIAGDTLPTNTEGQSKLDDLEKRAVNSGDPNDWIKLDKERLRQQRERQVRT